MMSSKLDCTYACMVNYCFKLQSVHYNSVSPAEEASSLSINNRAVRLASGNRTELFLFVYVPERSNGFELDMMSEVDAKVAIRPPAGTILQYRCSSKFGLSERFPSALGSGVWQLRIAFEEPDRTCSILISGLATLFVYPETGCTLSHFPGPGPLLYLEAGQDYNLYTYVPADMQCFHLQATSLNRRDAMLRRPAEEWEPLGFRVTERADYASQIFRVEGKGGWWEFAFKASAKNWRAGIAEGLPVFFAPISEAIPYAVFDVHTDDPQGRPLPARVEMQRHGTVCGIQWTQPPLSLLCYARPGTIPCISWIHTPGRRRRPSGKSWCHGLTQFRSGA